MMTKRHFVMVAAGLAAALGLGAPARAQERLPVVASFSILGDFVQNVGGDRVSVITLVGPDGDGHTFQPSPKNAKEVAAAKVVFVNGFGFEGWMPRLVKSSGTKAPIVEATKGVASHKMAEEEGAEHTHDHAHDDKHEGKGHDEAHEKGHAHDHGHDHGETDPHAWQSVGNAKLMVANVRDGLIAADPEGKSVYEANAAAYTAKLDELETEVKDTIGKIPAERRRVITSHDAFGYFAEAYGLQFIAPQGVSTEAEASAKAVAKIITQIKAEKIPAVFLENISDPRLIKRISDETGARIGGTVFSDALSKREEGGATYIEMMRHNIREFAAALAG
jgi:zinc/manganese transport system substrate-binding protein